MEDKLIPISEAAQQLGITPVAIRNAILRGRFSAIKMGRDWFTTQEAVEAYRPRTPGKRVQTLTEIKR